MKKLKACLREKDENWEETAGRDSRKCLLPTFNIGVPRGLFISGSSKFN